MPPSPTRGAARSTLSRILLPALILTACVTVPYLVPAPYSISRSWVAGFSNRTAVLLFTAGAVFFAFYTRGRLAAAEDRHDTALPWTDWAVAAGLTLLLGVALCKPRLNILPGYESLYFMNRLQMLAAGLAPYRQFEFLYGPLLLYPILWMQRLMHDSVRGFDLAWLLFWQIGIGFLWTTVRALDRPLHARRTVFYLLLASQLAAIVISAPNYSPFRAYCAAFLIAAVHLTWRHTQNAGATTLAAILAEAFALGCSTEQAIATLVGCAVLLLLLSLRQPRRFAPALLLTAVGSLLCGTLAARHGLLEPLRAFAAGGYSDPLIPSISSIPTLIAYLASACAALLAWRRYRAGSDLPLTLPLTAAGFVLLPNAMGRCDWLHITAATPALVVGVAAIAGLPGVRRWWFPTFTLALVVLPLLFYRLAFQGVIHPATNRDPALLTQGYTHPLSDSQWYVSEEIAVRDLPCDRTYFTPSYMPDPQQPFLPRCLDTGYFLGFVDVTTPGAIAAKILELERHATQPLLLQNSPLEAQLPLQLTSMHALDYGQLTPWVPPSRHAPLTYAPIIACIRAHWTPGPILLDGRLRIWNPTVTR